MPQFSYQAAHKDGQNVAGSLSAESLAAAIAELESRGLTVHSIGLASAGPDQSGFRSADEASRAEATTLEDHFVEAVNRRETLVPALNALASEFPSGRGRREIQQLADAVQHAQTSSDLRRSKVACIWLPLLVTGFDSESSTQRFSELISYASRESRNRSNRRRLLAYPLILLVLVLVVVTFVSTIALPTFDDMFNDFGLALPSPTRTVLFVANQIRFHSVRTLIAVLAVTMVVYGCARLWAHFAITTRLLGRFTSGNTVNVSVMSSLTSQLAELLSIELSLSDALWLAGQSCQHYHFRNVAEQLARDAYDSGGSLKASPVAHNLPANVIHALEAAPGGQPNIKLLRELSAMYGDRASQRIDWSGGVLAQLAIVGVGLVVGYVVIAMFMPMIFMVSSLS